MFKQPKFRWFQCIDTNNCQTSDLALGGYLEAGGPEFEQNAEQIQKDETNTFYFFGRSYSDSVWLSDIKMLFLLTRQNVLQLEKAAIEADATYHTTDYSKLRKYVCELWLASRSVILRSKNQYNLSDQLIPNLKNTYINIKKLQQLPDYVLFNSAKQNDTTNFNASFHFLHLLLDLHWLSLTLHYYTSDDLAEKLEVFEKNLHILLTDLFQVMHRKFQRIDQYSDLCNESPFLCSCFKELWLLIQLFVENLHLKLFCKDFWHYFNKAAKECFDLENCNEINAIMCLWLVYHIACVQGYDQFGTFIGPQYFRVVSNYSLVEECLKIITAGSNKVDEKQLCVCLQLLAFFQINWWQKDAPFDLLPLLWEYFYKRLDFSFSLIIETGNFSKSKSPDFISWTNNVLNHNLSVWCPNINSYDIFLCLLNRDLRSNPSHWQKLKGRIYSKLSAAKLIALTDVGLQNLIQLFFVLANSVSFNELTDKLQSLLNQLPTTRTGNNPVIWCAHLSLLLMRAERGMPLSGSGIEICAPISFAVYSASNDRSKAHLMQIYIDGIKKLLDSDAGLLCQAHVLFGDWILRYLRWCSHSEMSHLLEFLCSLVEKLRTIGGSPEWWTMLERHVVPSIFQLCVNSDAIPQVSDLAAALVLADATRYKMLLEHMTGDTINISLSIKFLKALLEPNWNNTSQLTDTHQSLIIQLWIRIAVLSTDRSDLSELTQMISYLSQWPATIGSFDVMSDEDPLYVVIRIVGTRVSDAKTMVENYAVKKWIETYFGRMDRWAAPVLSAAERGENASLVLRVYTCAALLFLHCAPALYIKNINTCLFYRLTSTLLLPTSVLRNKKPADVILVALRRTWHLFARGITQLDYRTDAYIERTLRDFVTRYVPYMNDASSPIIRCLDSEFSSMSTEFMLSKIANTFIACKSKTSHEFSVCALKLALEMVRAQCNGIEKLELFLLVMLPVLFEQLVFVEENTNKQIVLQIIECIKTKEHYVELRMVLISSVTNIIDKHLAFYSINIFRLLEMLISLLPVEIEAVQPNLIEAIQKVERMRGVGFDNTLRKGLQRIDDIINQQSK